MTTTLLKPGRCRPIRRGLYQLFLPIAYLVLASCVAEAADALKLVHTAEFGDVSFYGPKDSPQGFVVLFSGEEGINEQDPIAITRLFDSGMLVAVINARLTLKILGQANAHQSCVDLSLPLERLSHKTQEDWQFTQYYEPILLGRDAGGTLVYAALAQAPASTFAGGVSVDLAVSLKLARKLCGLNTIAVGPDEQRVSPEYRLGGWWRVAGTYPLKPEVMAVLGIDSFRYFWSKRTPESVAQDLARIIMHYRKIWHVKRVVLIGYSFGADILPFAYNRLASEVQRKITMIALLAPQRFASFEIDAYSGSTSKPNPVILAIEPEVGKVDPAKWQCIYAEQDADNSLCTTEVMKQGEVIQQFGKLLFDDTKDNDLAEFILSGIERRALADTHR